TPKSNGTSCDPGGMCATGAVCAYGECQLAPASCPDPSGPCKVATCDPATGACQEKDKLGGAPCDPKTACMAAGICDDQGRCVGSPVPNGQSCTREGGAIGACSAGVCEALDPASGGGDAATGNPDADPKAAGG